jgi:hypothetical protein
MRVLRRILSRWIAFNAVARVLSRREVAREVFMPLTRQILRMDATASDLTFDDMVGIVYRSRSLHEAVVMQMANIAAFWRCRAELAATERDRDEACSFESIITDSANELAAGKLDDRATAWVQGLIEARAREERTHHPDYVPVQWQKTGGSIAA